MKKKNIVSGVVPDTKEISKAALRRERRKAATRRDIRAYWLRVYRNCRKRYAINQEWQHLLWHDAETINSFLGLSGQNWYGLELAREEAEREADRVFGAMRNAWHRYSVA